MAQAWGQEGWADHSGVSRTMSALSEEESAQYAALLDKATQPLIDAEVQLALASGRLVLDGDLTPRPVSNSSKSYPGSSYGYMDGKLQLGYQAAVITMGSPTYGRLGLSASRHTGKTVSATQAEGLALEAERRLGRRPWRRTDLLTWHWWNIKHLPFFVPQYFRCTHGLATMFTFVHCMNFNMIWFIYGFQPLTGMPKLSTVLSAVSFSPTFRRWLV